MMIQHKHFLSFILLPWSCCIPGGTGAFVLGFRRSLSPLNARSQAINSRQFLLHRGGSLGWNSKSSSRSMVLTPSEEQQQLPTSPPPQSQQPEKKPGDDELYHTEFTEFVENVERFEIAEFLGIGLWLLGLSSFILMNEYVGPWPQAIMKGINVRTWLLLHYLGGMLFAGGIIMTTCIEWLVANTKDSRVLHFWFSKVPVLDAALVLPGLTLTMVAGTGVSIQYYGGLENIPYHIEMAFWTLVAFAIWWAVTDLTTQPKAAQAIEKWSAEVGDEVNPEKEIPAIIHFRKISNVVSCMFIVALYALMALKPGLYH